MPEAEPLQLLLSSTRLHVGSFQDIHVAPPHSQDLLASASTVSLTMLILLFPFHLRGLNAL